MPNLIDANGLQVNTRQELVDFFTGSYQRIYGSDINLASNTPDGQMMNLNIQVILDLQDLLVQIYNMFDPDNAVGVILDQRVAINGIQRQAGTYTITDVTITVSQSVNLYGLDQTDQAVYTVADNAGNNWFLQTTALGLLAGSHILSFRAAVPGAVLTVPNTIDVPVTIVLGVDVINNPSTYTTLGQNEETDAALKIRRQKSVSLASQGYLKGLLAALENTPGVTFAAVNENDTSITNGDGVPGHSIWVIVAGTAAAADIAQDIYVKRNAGCGMFGQTSYTIIQADGSPFTIYWDVVITQNVFIAFTVTSINGLIAPNIAAIRAGLVTAYVPGVNQEVNINALATAVQSLDSNSLVTNSGFSTGALQVATLSGVAASGTFQVQYDGNLSAAINWNDAIGVIQTKVQAVTGLSGALVTGSIASQTLTFNLAGLGSGVEGLITISNNTLQTSAPAPITFSFNENYTNTLSPSSKRNQLILSSENIVILPMQLVPAASTIPAGNVQQYTGLGGYGTYVYSFVTNNSGGTIDPSTGAYTAGVTANVTDTLKVTDAFMNFATATVQVI